MFVSRQRSQIGAHSPQFIKTVSYRKLVNKVLWFRVRI